MHTVCGPQETEACRQQPHEEQQLGLRRQQDHLAHDQGGGDRRQTVAEHADRLEKGTGSISIISWLTFTNCSRNFTNCMC